MSWIGRDKVICFQPPCHGQGHFPPDQAAYTIQPGFEHFQGWREKGKKHSRSSGKWWSIIFVQLRSCVTFKSGSKRHTDKLLLTIEVGRFCTAQVAHELMLSHYLCSPTSTAKTGWENLHFLYCSAEGLCLGHKLFGLCSKLRKQHNTCCCCLFKV